MKKETVTIILTVARYVLTAILGALGGGTFVAMM